MSQSLLRALDLLESLAESPASLDELASAQKTHKTTVMRQLHDLESRRFVFRDGQGKYHLGSAVFGLSSQALEQRDVRAVASSHLMELNDRIGHTMHLAVLEGRNVVYIDKLESKQPVRMYSRIGLTAALHSTAVAKVLLADLPLPTQRSIAESIDYPKLTENTILSPGELLAELAKVRAQGWAHDDVEHELLVHCIAAPIRDASGAVVAAASISVPTVLLDREGLLELVPGLIQTADEISTNLGYLAKSPIRK